MAKVLAFYDDTDILGWLVNVDLSEAAVYIKNGYPWLINGYNEGTVKAINIEVPEEEQFMDRLWGVVNGEIVKIGN